MSDDDGPPEEEASEGLPAWMGTFADLMALLMCFFVLLLSFSEMEAKKFKQVAGSMKQAFGVQQKIKKEDIPKGTSIIAQEFSPGKPTMTQIPVIEQEATEQLKQDLDFTDSGTKGDPQDGERAVDLATLIEQEQQKAADSDSQESSLQKNADDSKEELKKKSEQIADMLEKALEKEISKDLLEVLTYDTHVAIRIRERGSFPSGRAGIKPSFVPVIDKISKTIRPLPGRVIISGHTDNIPIRTKEFRSNWELSAARAATFVHFMTMRNKIDGNRFQIRADADAAPIASNKTREGRAQNRRVEILVMAAPDIQVIDKPRPTASIDSG